MGVSEKYGLLRIEAIEWADLRILRLENSNTYNYIINLDQAAVKT